MSQQDENIDKMIDLFEEASTDGHYDEKYSMEVDQPKHFSWVSIYCSTLGLATDTSTAICYDDDEDFQQQLIEVVRVYFNTDTLGMLSSGKITNFGINIGPEQPGGGNINDELGLEVSYE